ncbi:hypothetical protein, partial [Mycobacterium canetti]|uniref:hypothetical protein n=1 Tax=Mycobacterium canetti TaxID=78331 RepID=UPI0005B33416
MGDRYRAGDRVLYGGSMSPKDVDDLATQQDVDDGQSIERRWTGSGPRRWRRAPPT